MKFQEERSKLNGEENIIPMINVVFLLLIFFLLAGTLTQRPPFELDPVSTTLTPLGNAPENGLYVSAAGQLYFQGGWVSLERLAVLAGDRSNGNNTLIDVVVDRRLTSEDLFPVMEALTKSGVTKIRLITERSGG